MVRRPLRHAVDRPFETPDDSKGGPEELGLVADGAVGVPNETWPLDALVRYAAHGRRKVHETLASVTDADLERPCPADHPRAGETFADALEVNLAHVEHGRQLAAFPGRP